MASRRIGWAAIVLLLPAALTAVLWKERHRLIENNFREVEAGRVYAGAYQHPRPLARILTRHRIKTVLCLRSAEDLPDDAREQQVLTAHGVRFRRIVIPSDRPDSDKLARVEEAVRVVADPENQPVFVHCRGGSHRTGAVISAYRVLCSGWDARAALAESERYGGGLDDGSWVSVALHARGRDGLGERHLAMGILAAGTTRF